MRNPTNLGTFRGVNNIIAIGNTWLARDGVVLLALFFGLLWMAYEVMK